MRELELKETHEYTPHMEYFFDEITEILPIRCPVTGKFVNVEAIRCAHNRHTPFVEIVRCEGCGKFVIKEKQHLDRLNRTHFHH